MKSLSKRRNKIPIFFYGRSMTGFSQDATKLFDTEYLCNARTIDFMKMPLTRSYRPVIVPNDRDYWISNSTRVCGEIHLIDKYQELPYLDKWHNTELSRKRTSVKVELLVDGPQYHCPGIPVECETYMINDSLVSLMLERSSKYELTIDDGRFTKAIDIYHQIQKLGEEEEEEEGVEIPSSPWLEFFP